MSMAGMTRRMIDTLSARNRIAIYCFVCGFICGFARLGTARWRMDTPSVRKPTSATMYYAVCDCL